MNEDTKQTKQTRRIVNTPPIEVIFRKRKQNESLSAYAIHRKEYNQYEDDLIRYEKYLEKQKQGDEKNKKLSVDIAPDLMEAFKNKVKENTNSDRKVSMVILDFIVKYNNDQIIDDTKSKKSNGVTVTNTNDYDNLKATIAQLEEDKKMMETLLKGQPSTSNDPFLQSEITRLNNELVTSKEANEIAQEVSIENDCEIEDLKMKLEAANNTITNLRGAA